MAVPSSYALYGGPSYNYNYGKQELDPVELQYFQEQALQQSLQQQQLANLAQSNYNAEHSYTQSFLQRYNRGGKQILSGFSPIPEDEAVLNGQDGEYQYQRRAEAALESWKMGGSFVDSQTGGSALALSSTATGIELKEFLSKRGDTQLQGLHRLAALGDRTGIMNFMKQHGPSAPLNELDENGCTPLMYAAIADSRLAIEMLLNFSAKREKTDPEGRTAVHYAAFFGKHRALKFLIDTASDWTPCDNYGRTPLHWSCVSGNTRCLAVLLKQAQVVMGDINPRDNEGMTPLHCAAHFCRPRHIELLHEAECDFTAVDFEEKTALHWTASNPDPSCIQVIAEIYPSLLNKQDASGSTILHYATEKGTTHLVAALLEIEGIDVDIKDGSERTALHWACVETHSEIVQLLLGSRALDSCIDANGLTALHYSVQNKSTSCVKAFVRMGEMTHLPNNEGMTPLMEAAANDAPSIVKLLLKNEMIVKSVDHTDPHGLSSLHLAAQCGSKDSVKALLSKKANPNLPDQAERTPIFLATQNGYGDCIQVLVSKGGEVDLLDGEGHAPLHKAVIYDKMESVQVLTMNGVDLNMKDSVGNTALHMAAYGGNDTLVSLLLEQSANPNLQDENGVSPIHLAAMEGHGECVRSLLAHGAYINFVDFSEERYTPMDYARLYNHSNCVDILREAGGVGTEDIRSMAALTIQTAYRGHRARVLRAELALKNHAATIITKYARRFLQRKRFVEMKRRHYAAITIQAHLRGHMQRVRFRIQLSEFRERDQRWRRMKGFSNLVQQGHVTGILRNFIAADLSPVLVESKEAEEMCEKERACRLEASMQMRAIYQEKQRRWQTFREAERQRRIDKAHQEEMNRLNDIIAESKARREYSNFKFQHSLIVRSHHEAALTIQRAYRRIKQIQSDKAKWCEQVDAVCEKVRERAARLIQKTWRHYHHHQLYKAMHYVPVMTGPVITFGKRVESPPRLQSYARQISITGNPQRKRHLTTPSGFHIFRPKTRDLLFRPNLTHNSGPIRQEDGGILTDLRPLKFNYTLMTTRRKRLSDPFKTRSGPAFGGDGKSKKKSTSKRESVALPKMFLKPSATQTNIHLQKQQEIIHLPKIMPSS